MQRLGDYIKEYSARNKFDEEIPVYSVTNSNGFCRDYFGKEVASNNKRTYKIVPRNAFAYNPSRINVGSVDYQHYEDRVIVSPLYNVFTVDEKILPQYLYFYLKSPNTMKRIRTVASGSVRDNLKLSMLCEFPIQVPSINRQQNIIELLEKVQRIIDENNDELEKLDNLVKARFVEMFGVPGANSKGWNEIKLGEVCSLQNGYAFKSSDYINKSGVLNCRMSNIRPDGGFDAEYHPKYLPEEYWDKCSGYRLFDGDVIIAMTDMASDPKILGVPTIVSTNGKKFLLNQRVGKLSFLHDDRMNRVYLMHSLGQKYIRKELAKSAAGSTQINVGKPAILNINIYDPPRSLQDQFATFVAQVDKSKFAVQKSLEKTQLLFDSLMQEYFG